jgi:hypothetical protein
LYVTATRVISGVKAPDRSMSGESKEAPMKSPAWEGNEHGARKRAHRLVPGACNEPNTRRRFFDDRIGK